jgi:acyl transferase domain-containing protein/acyl carrier protein
MARELPVERLNGNLASRLAFGRDGKFSGMDDPGTQQHWYGNFIDDISSFDHALFGISPREAQYMDPQQRLLLETAYQALDSSGYLRHHRREDFDNVGCFVGTTYTEYLENTTACSVTAYSATGTIRAFQTGRISYHFGWSGPSEAIDTACSSSIVAVHRACRAIQAGECPMALAGGVNLITGIQNYLDLRKAGFLNQTGQCKPFDQGADGYCRADGVGLVVLKSLRQAVAEGDDILGVIPAVATNHGGLSSSITVPSPRAQRELYRTVLRRAGMEARDISYVEAHGTGTQVGDPIEISSIREVLGGSQRAGEPLHLGSLKANVGHSETAAGIGSLLKVLAMLQHSALPPLAGFQTLNPKIPALEPDQLHISRQVLPWKPSLSLGSRAALISSYGASGSNSALICCEATTERPSGAGNANTAHGGLSYPIFLSAATIESLGRSAAKLAAYIHKSNGNGKKLDIGDIAFTLYERRKHYPLRWTYTATGLDALAQSLDKDADQNEVPKAASNTDIAATATTDTPVVLVFSGQSKKTIQLSREWLSWFPRLRFHINQCDEILRGLGHETILPDIFQSEPIEDVITLQCGTFAMQYACAMSWIDAGLKIIAVIGHSFGELTAMVVSGALSLHDGLKLVAGRASLMKFKWGAERGTMLAIHAARDVVEEIIAVVRTEAGGHGEDPSTSRLEIACFNSARSQVVVGSAAAVEKAQEVISSNSRFHGVQQQLVQVSHGFHSTFTEPLLQDLGALAETLTFHRPSIPLELCIESPSRASGLEDVTADRIVLHTRTPVYFYDAITRLEQRLGPSCVWLEAGADSPILAMAKRALSNASQHIFLPIKAEADKNAITTATTKLWKEGISTSFWAFISLSESGIKPVWLPPYQFQQNSHWLEWKDLGREVHKAIRNTPTTGAEPPTSMKLVTPLGTIPNTWASMEFAVHTMTSRFTRIVSGHAVRGFPVCPASMYMECVVMAAQTIKPEISPKALRFENISFMSALGINSRRSVSLVMDGAGEYLTWAFSFSSSTPATSSHGTAPNGVAASTLQHATIHAKGRFSVVSQTPDLHLHERIMAEQVQGVLSDPSAERFNAGRAYALFSRVVNYADILRGISHITIKGKHAVAQVTRPAVPVSSAESRAVDLCDTVILDTFIQVVGLLINSSEACREGEVFIATGIDSMVIQDCNFSKYNEWTVYAMMSPSSPSPEQTNGDLLVFTANGKLVLTGSGISFTRYRIDKFEKLLQSVSRSPTVPLSNGHQPTHDPPSIPALHRAIARSAADLDGDEMGEKTIVASEALSAASATKRLGRLGMDSLTATQLRAQLGRKLVPGEQELVFLAESLQEGFKDIVRPADHLTPVDVVGDGLVDDQKGRVRNSTAGNPPPSNRIQIRQRLLELISESCGQPLRLASTKDEASLQDIGVDSLAVVELATSVEDAFGVRYGDGGIDVHSTMAEMLDYLQLNATRD